MTEKKRYFIIMTVCILMNYGLNGFAAHFNLPMWLDMTGTAAAAILLEPAAGLIVGLINNFYLAIFEYGAGSLIYYSVSAVTALLCGLIIIRKDIRLSLRIVIITVAVIILSSLLSAVIAMWESGGVPSLSWEQYYYEMALSMGWNRFFACLLGTFIVKIYDVLASVLIIAGMYFILPKSMKPVLTADK